MATDIRPRRSERIEARSQPAGRALIDRAVNADQAQLTEFVIAHLTNAARRVLADRADAGMFHSETVVMKPDGPVVGAASCAASYVVWGDPLWEK
ncbi:MAG: DUF1778 domain-containing protein [Acidimicrobiaceae bacterium]|nr:DUF1778 domain-containing protein [Acidimicrobiaceae bacterium]